MADREHLSICHIVAPGKVGGLERVVQGLARGHHEAGLTVHVISVIAPGDDEHPFTTPLREAGVSVQELRLPGRAVLQEVREVYARLRSLAPNVVHCHGYRPDLLHGTIARLMGIPVVTTEHGSSKLGGRTALFEWLQVRLFRSATAVVAVSSPIARRLEAEGVPSRLIHVIPNGWAGGTPLLSRASARAQLGIPREVTVVAFVGRLIPAKGPDVFVRALLELDDPTVLAVVIGDGSEREALESLVRSAGVEDRFLFVGHQDNAAPLFSAFDLFVLSSRTEGTPIVLFEAMSAGVPAVVTNVGGVPDVVGESAALRVPSEDATAIAAAVRSVLDYPEEGRCRAEEALRRLKSEFHADLWLQRHEDLYRRAVREPGPTR